MVLPVQRLSSRAISSRCCWIRSPRRQTMRPRSCGLIFGQGPSSNALRAAVTARSMSRSSPLPTTDSGSSLAGLIGWYVSPESGACHFPATKISPAFMLASRSVLAVGQGQRDALGAQGQLGEARPGGVLERIRDGGGGRDDGRLAHTAGAEGAGRRRHLDN